MAGRMSWSTVPYPSDLSDREWALLEPELPAAQPGGRPRSVDRRRMLSGIVYGLRSGGQWRLLGVCCRAASARGPRWTPLFVVFSSVAARRGLGGPPDDAA